MSLKLCMVGCGDFALLCHGPAQRKYAALHRDTELSACCDRDADRALEYSKAFGFKRYYRDIPSMFAAERPDAVVLAVPPARTCEVASEVITYGIPVLLEKPPGLTNSELGRLVAVAEKSRTRVQVAFNRRYMPIMRQAKGILDTEFQAAPLGRIDYEMNRFNRWDPDFSTTAIHALDAVLHLAKSPIRTAELHFQQQQDGNQQTMNISMEAGCVSGTQVRLNIQPVSGHNSEVARIHAVGRSLIIHIPCSALSDAVGSLEYWRNDRCVTTFTDSGADSVERLGVYGETEAFLSAVRTGAEPAPGLRDCSQQVVLMEAIRNQDARLIAFKSA